MADLDFSIEFSGFNEGNSPLAHIDTKTFVGNRGQASEMKGDVISKPGFLTQAPALVDLTNGDQDGSVAELINFILDQPTEANVTFALGQTKMYKITPTTVVNDGSPTWPQTVINMASGESLVRLKANLYGFFNKASGGDIVKMPLATELLDHTWGSVTDQALEGDVPHPSAVKEDVMVFGNGRYAGVYVEGAATLDVQKLDFGEGTEVADVVFHANMWWIAVNNDQGKRGQIYMYDGSAISNVLSDETGIGEQEIGFLYVHNGTIFVAYKDLSSSIFAIGFLSGRQIKPLRYFSGDLPDHKQKSLYKNTIIFSSLTDIWSFGSSIEQLPLQISKLADGGHATVGGIATPFGTPLVASSDGGSNHRLAKFSGFSTDSNWKSVFVDVTKERMLGKIKEIIVYSKSLGANAQVDVSLEGNQGDKTSNVLEYTGTGQTRKVFRTITMPAVEDIRLVLDYSNGNTSNDCPIRKVVCLGNYIER